LGTLFYRFISENLTHFINSTEKDIDYKMLSDEQAEYGKKDIINDKGFFIYPSQLFTNVVKKLSNRQFKEHLNEHLFDIFKSIEASAIGTESEKKIKGLFDDFDTNSKKIGNTIDERNKLLEKLLISINDLNIGHYHDNSIDMFGDAYEYLMGMYASQAGKSGGEYFTPQEVSELLAKICVVDKTSVNKVYDPACGSGSLLLKFAKILGKKNVSKGFYGQEINRTTYNLCRINMFLHDINFSNFDIACGDTILQPAH
jgi:type I restriction enzyme M protein